MRLTISTFMMMALATTGCMLDEEEDPMLGDVEQEGTFNQGTFNQGTFNQGTFNQGPSDGVWGFEYTNWENSGMYLRNTSISGGELRGSWYKTPLCRLAGQGLTRSCEWWAAGYASCTANTQVTVRAGACSMSTPRASMVRVCSGVKPCLSTTALAQSDAACNGTTNPGVTFTCPWSGRYFVMVAPKATGVSSFSFTTSSSPSASLNKWLARADFVGTTMIGMSETATHTAYRITGLAAMPSYEDPTGRSVFYTLVNAGNSTALCGGGDNRAIPLTGRWKASGHVDISTTTFTFACTAGAIAKCYRLGYRPWDISSNGVSLRDYHQTCTRGARADFCGDGSSFTVNGTTIDMYDRLGHVDPASEGFAFEAVWRREDVLGSDDISVNYGPTCLSKKRWDTLPYNDGGSCTALADPRLGSDDVQAAMCDDRTTAGWWAQSTNNLIITESAFNDAGLWRWTKSDGTEFRSTTACTTTANTSCNSGYVYSPGTNEPRFMGAIYSATIQPGALPANTLPLYSLRNLTTGDYVTTTDTSLPGYGSPTLEGYILDSSCLATDTCPAKRLDLYFGNNEYLTTTLLEPVNGPYTYVRTLGYLPR